MPPIRIVSMLLALLALVTACEDRKPAPTATSAPPPAPAKPLDPRDPTPREYAAVGVITKVDAKLGSVELDHEPIEGLMPAMRMEWYLKDRSLLDGLAVGQKVDFTVEYRAGRETITAIKARPK